jgi:hypothetical protein
LEAIAVLVNQESYILDVILLRILTVFENIEGVTLRVSFCAGDISTLVTFKKKSLKRGIISCIYPFFDI